MAASFSCDGCGAALGVPLQVGHVLKRDYCEACKALAEKFVAEEEQLRAATHAGFERARGVIIEAAREKLRLLPDVPDVSHGTSGG